MNKASLRTFCLIAVFLFGYYLFVALAFIVKNPIEEFPSLRARFGTIIWHSEDKDGVLNAAVGAELHTYCYYPSSDANFQNKGGEYILRRVKNYKECNNWYGIVELRESYWVSEREKIWWSKEQHISDSLAKKENNSTSNN